MTKRTLAAAAWLLAAISLASLGSSKGQAQGNPIPVLTLNFTGSWPSNQMQTVTANAQMLWPALNNVAQAGSSQWTLSYSPGSAQSDACANTSSLDGSLTLSDFASQMALAMFTPCPLFKAGTNGGYAQGAARAKAFLALRALAASGTAGVAPQTSLAIFSANASRRYFAAGGGLAFATAGLDAAAAPFELFAEALNALPTLNPAAGAGPTLKPLDRVWAQVAVPSGTGADPAQAVALFFAQADSLLGEIAGRKPSAWLEQPAALFTLDATQRSALGFAAAGDPTNGLWLDAYAYGTTPGWNGSQTVVNPTTVSASLVQRSAGVAAPPSGVRTGNFQITDRNGATYSVDFDLTGGSGTVAISLSGLAEGAYAAQICVKTSATTCDPTLVRTEHVIVDRSGWTAGKLVVIANGPGFAELGQASLSLASGQPYTLDLYPGAVAVGGLSAGYAEVALTDGASVRKFPWAADAPNANIVTWTPLEDPNLLSILEYQSTQPATGGSSFLLSPNTWFTLATAGASTGDPDAAAVALGSAIPTSACSMPDAVTEVVLSYHGKTWDAPMYVCSWGSIDILTPPDLPPSPANDPVSVQITRGGVTSNALTAAVSTAAPYEMLTDQSLQFGSVLFTAGPFTGQPVTAANPAHIGDLLSIYYTGCGALSEPIAAGAPAPLDHLVYAMSPATVSVGGTGATILFNGLAPGWAGLCQLNMVTPTPAGVFDPTTSTTVNASVQIDVGGQASNQFVLPVVVDQSEYPLGNPAAPVTMVEYADYQCPYCRQFFENVWPQLEFTYVDTGLVQFIFRDLAFLGQDSVTAAEATRCAGDQGQFWTFHDYLFNHQGSENSGWADAANEKLFAAALGLDTARFGLCLDYGKYAQAVQASNNQAAARDVNGTPTAFINGAEVYGAQALSVYTQLINAALPH